MEFPFEVGYGLRIKFYFLSFLAVIRNGLSVRSEDLNWREFAFLCLVLSWVKDREKMKKTLSAPGARPMLSQFAKHGFLINQKARCWLDIIDGDLEMEIIKSELEYKFRLNINPNRPKTPFVHDLTPLTDIFYLGLYDRYNYSDGVVVDIGGYIGDTAIYFAKKGAKYVFTYEPNPLNFEYLLKNVHLNKLENSITAYNCAVSMERRRLSVPNMGGAGSVFASRGPNFYDVENVKPTDLFNLIDSVSFLKVDCKGCELELFDSSFRRVSNKVKSIIIDPGRLSDQQKSEIISNLIACGYHMDKSFMHALYFHNESNAALV